jgi:hypothetical protein
MNRAPAPVTSIEDMSLNWLWAVPKLPRLSSNHLAVSGCTVDVPPFDQLGRLIVGWVTAHAVGCNVLRANFETAQDHAK